MPQQLKMSKFAILLIYGISVSAMFSCPFTNIIPVSRLGTATIPASSSRYIVTSSEIIVDQTSTFGFYQSYCVVSGSPSADGQDSLLLTINSYGINTTNNPTGATNCGYFHTSPAQNPTLFQFGMGNIQTNSQCPSIGQLQGLPFVANPNQSPPFVQCAQAPVSRFPIELWGSATAVASTSPTIQQYVSIDADSFTFGMPFSPLMTYCIVSVTQRVPQSIYEVRFGLPSNVMCFLMELISPTKFTLVSGANINICPTGMNDAGVALVNGTYIASAPSVSATYTPSVTATASATISIGASPSATHTPLVSAQAISNTATSGGGSTGGIVAAIIIILIVLGVVGAYFYWRKTGNQCLDPVCSKIFGGAGGLTKAPIDHNDDGNSVEMPIAIQGLRSSGAVAPSTLKSAGKVTKVDNVMKASVSSSIEEKESLAESGASKSVDSAPVDLKNEGSDSGKPEETEGGEEDEKVASESTENEPEPNSEVTSTENEPEPSAEVKSIENEPEP
jgi:hypothetical protein